MSSTLLRTALRIAMCVACILTVVASLGVLALVLFSNEQFATLAQHRMWVAMSMVGFGSGCWLVAVGFAVAWFVDDIKATLWIYTEMTSGHPNTLARFLSDDAPAPQQQRRLVIVRPASRADKSRMN